MGRQLTGLDAGSTGKSGNTSAIGPTDSSAYTLGKNPVRSGEIKGENTAQPLPMSDPWAVSSQGTENARSTPNGKKLQSKFKRGM